MTHLSFIEWLFIICVAAIVGILGFAAVDHIGAKSTDIYIAVVESKEHRDSYITTTYIKVGEILVPQTEYHPEEWKLIMASNSLSGTADVSEEIYGETKHGRRAAVKFWMGKISGSVVKVEIIRWDPTAERAQ
jgi:desulfoferrodoxin (superoxide reductase-like protein)